MTDPQNILPYVNIVLGALFVVLLLCYVVPRLINRNKEREKLRYAEYPTASAGDTDGNIPETEKSISVEFNTFYDKANNRIDPDRYYKFVVAGNSMQFCGIYDKNLIFVAKGFRIVHLKEFPYILVIRWSDSESSNEPKYKIRRAWGLAQYDPKDRFEKEVRAIMASDEFNVIRTLKNKDGVQAYLGDEKMVDDFLKKRLEPYVSKYIDCDNPDKWNETVVISTTFDTKEKFIHFSIHPIGNIVGIVEESFTVTEPIS